MLHKLQEAGLTAKPAKCQFAMTQCTYLGHIVVYCDILLSAPLYITVFGHAGWFSFSCVLYRKVYVVKYTV